MFYVGEYRDSSYHVLMGWVGGWVGGETLGSCIKWHLVPGLMCNVGRGHYRTHI